MNSSRAAWWEHAPRTTGLSGINPTALLGYVGGDKSDKAGSNPATRARMSGGGGIGRREGLKTLWGYSRAGSTPVRRIDS